MYLSLSNSGSHGPLEVNYTSIVLTSPKTKTQKMAAAMPLIMAITVRSASLHLHPVQKRNQMNFNLLFEYIGQTEWLSNVLMIDDHSLCVCLHDRSIPYNYQRPSPSTVLSAHLRAARSSPRARK